MLIAVIRPKNASPPNLAGLGTVKEDGKTQKKTGLQRDKNKKKSDCYDCELKFSAVDAAKTLQKAISKLNCELELDINSKES